MLKSGLIRFLLASLVIFYHLSGSIFIGTMAVYCFFILSGYWVTYMYEAKYLKCANPIKIFYQSRILRIFPVYILSAILALAVLCVYRPEMCRAVSIFGPIEKIHFYFSNMFLVGYNLLTLKPLVPAWSLDIELQFYVLLPLLTLFARTRSSRILSLSLSIVITIILSAFYPQSFLSKTVLVYLSYFFIGIFIYKERIKFNRRVELVFNLLLIGILILHFALSKWVVYDSIKASANYELYFNELLSLFAIPVLCNSVYRKGNNLDRQLGDISYVLYLLHWVLIIPYDFYIRDLNKVQRIPIVIIYLISTYVLSYVIFKYYDKPIDSFRRKWSEKSIGNLKA